MTVHLVYPHAPRESAPDVIGHRLAAHLRERHDVVLHDWDELRSIRPGAGDVLLGHACPVPGTVWRRSARHPGWARRILMSPYNGDPEQVGFLDPLVDRADQYLAITGRYWFDRVGETPMARWLPRMVHLDLAIDRASFPPIDRSFAPPGKRRLLYLGHAGWQKNVGYLARIADRLPRGSIGWIGSGRPPIPHVVAHGRRDTTSPSTRALIASYDATITVGRFDANPMTVLETMAWGLVPMCTPQSGYVEADGVLNVPLDDVDGAVRAIEAFQAMPDEALRSLASANARRLDQHFNWQRFCAQVQAAVDSRDRVELPSDPAASSALRGAARRSRYAPHRVDGRRFVAGAILHDLQRRLRS